MSKTTKKSRHVRKKDRIAILKRQTYQCANSPGIGLFRMENYLCPLWIFRNGYFDGAEYQIDHIVEHALVEDNSVNNLQALCPSCHTCKTRQFHTDTAEDRKSSESSISGVPSQTLYYPVSHELDHDQYRPMSDTFIESINNNSKYDQNNGVFNSIINTGDISNNIIPMNTMIKLINNNTFVTNNSGSINIIVK